MKSIKQRINILYGMNSTGTQDDELSEVPHNESRCKMDRSEALSYKVGWCGNFCW